MAGMDRIDMRSKGGHPRGIAVLVAMLFLVLSVFMTPGSSSAVEMNPDTGFDTPANWTAAQVLCGSATCTGSVTSSYAQQTSTFAKNDAVSYTYTESITPIGVGAQVTAASLDGYFSTPGALKAVAWTVEIFDNGGWVTVFSSADQPGAAMTALVDPASPLPYTTLGSTTQIRLTLAVTSNTNGSSVDMRADNLTITYTPAAAATTTLGDGSDPTWLINAPGDAVLTSQFTFVDSVSTDTVTQVTVATTGDTGEIANVQIFNLSSAQRFNDCTGGPVWTCSGGTAITATTTPTSYLINTTWKDHASMTVGTYSTTTQVTSFTSTNTGLGTDTAGNLFYVDNEPPANPTGFTGSASDGQVNFASWSNPGDGDFAVII
ncbi:hypothetical protein LCGC14_2212750, partial [marine sediment metagenome]